MGEEKKKEKKKKPKKVSPALGEFSAIKLALSQTTEAQRALWESQLKALVEPFALKAYKQSVLMHKAMLPVAMSLFRARQNILQVFQSPKVLETLVKYRESVQGIAETHLAINRMITTLSKQIAIPQITPKLEALPSQTKTAVNSLLRHIDFLEKELAKERKKNKALLKRIEETKKELKKKYVV